MKQTTARRAPRPLILASSSPRRKQLLESVGVAVRVHPVEIGESPLPGESAAALTLRLARLKVRAVARRFPGRVVIGADTVVARRGRVFGKPSSAAEARTMLTQLAGGWHDVVTSVALVTADGRLLGARSRTRVRLARLTPTEIRRYASSREPRDKAGGYAVQGAAAWFIEEVRGSVTNVIGLPLEKIRRLFAKAGVPTPPLAPVRAPRSGS